MKIIYVNTKVGQKSPIVKLYKLFVVTSGVKNENKIFGVIPVKEVNKNDMNVAIEQFSGQDIVLRFNKRDKPFFYICDNLKKV